MTPAAVVGIAAGAGGAVYAVRSDGAVFVLRRRGDLLADGGVARRPEWLTAPAVPGTAAALGQAAEDLQL